MTVCPSQSPPRVSSSVTFIPHDSSGLSPNLTFSELFSSQKQAGAPVRSSQNSLHCPGALSTDEFKQFAAQSGVSCPCPVSPLCSSIQGADGDQEESVGSPSWWGVARGPQCPSVSGRHPFMEQLTEHHFCSIDYARAFDCVDHNELWKTLKEMGIPDHLTCLLRNLYAGQEATVRTGHGTTDWFQIGKGVPQGCILSPCLFNLYAEYIMKNAGLEEAQAGIKIARRNVNNLRYADDTVRGSTLIETAHPGPAP